MCKCRCPQSPEEGAGSPGTQITGYELPDRGTARADGVLTPSKPVRTLAMLLIKQ